MRSFIRTNRVLGVLAIAFALVLGVGTSLVVAAPNGSPGVGHIGICHHTGKSRAHEFIYITPNASGVFHGHGRVGHQGGDDIIPAFSFVNSKGQTVSFSGQNLSTVYGGFTGAQLLANGCTLGTTTTTTTDHTTTAVSTTTTTTDHGTTTVSTTTTVIGHGHH